MDDKELKVTDKRMFTPEGELREEFRHLDREAEAGAEPEPTAADEVAGAEPATETAAKAPPEPAETAPEPAEGTPSAAASPGPAEPSAR